MNKTPSFVGSKKTSASRKTVKQSAVAKAKRRLQKASASMKAAPPPKGSPAKPLDSSAKSASNGHSSIERSFAMRHELLGGTVATNEVTAMLHISRQAVSARVQSGQLFAVKDTNNFRFPVWQFDSKQANGVVPGLPDVLRTLDKRSEMAPYLKLSWFVWPNPALGGLTPARALKDGRLDEVLIVARAANAD